MKAALDAARQTNMEPISSGFPARLVSCEDSRNFSAGVAAESADVHHSFYIACETVCFDRSWVDRADADTLWDVHYPPLPG